MINRRRRRNAPRSLPGVVLVSPEARALAGDLRRCNRCGREVMVGAFLEVIGGGKGFPNYLPLIVAIPD